MITSKISEYERDRAHARVFKLIFHLPHTLPPAYTGVCRSREETESEGEPEADGPGRQVRQHRSAPPHEVEQVSSNNK